MQATTLVGSTAGAVFAGLAALHVFWALGGKAIGGAAVPEVNGAPAFVPSAAATLAVAAALTAAMLVVLAQSGLVPVPLPAVAVRAAAYVLGTVFLLRAIGEFRLVGFFKSVRGTQFATYDTYLYSPLCLLLGLAVLWLAWGRGGK